MYRVLTSLLISCVFVTTAEAHRGKQDKYSGHNNRKEGNYHFHKGPLAGRTYDSKEEALKALRSVQNQEPTPTRSTPPTKVKGVYSPALGLQISPEVRTTPYERNDYAYSQSIELSIIQRQGGIFSPYTLRCFTDRGETDIEHIVAVSEAHESGMSERTDAERKAFGNDLDNLTLASPRVNRYEKVAKDPAEWLPKNNRCWYVAKFLEIKKKYNLTMDQAEADAVNAEYKDCTSFAMVKPSCN